MKTIKEGHLSFTFNSTVKASKYDAWSFYRNQFQNRCARDNKAVDLLCNETSTSWLIEVKDYRQNPRTKPTDLADEVATKVRDTLAGLVAAKTQAVDANEQEFARNWLSTHKIRVVCHLEQPSKSSRLRPRVIEPDKLKQKLRTVLKAIDPHPIVTNTSDVSGKVPWQVQ